MTKLTSGQPYLSLPPLEWDDIPRFAVLTGANGVGKSHLLSLLGTAVGWLHRLNSSSVSLDVEPRTTAFLPATWRLEDVSVSHEMFKPVTDFVDQVRQSCRRGRQVPAEEPFRRIFDEFLLSLAKTDLPSESMDELVNLGEGITHADVFARLGPYDLVKQKPDKPLENLAQVFFAHVNESFTRFMLGRSPESTPTSGSPCDTANSLLNEFDVRFRLLPPVDLRIPYAPQLRLLETEHVVRPSELSSGEQSILALVALIVTAQYCSRKTGAGPLLLLLDEPDAHLHTSLIKDYLGHLERLTKVDIQVVMVTHRPETILLCPDDSLVELRRDRENVSFVPVPRTDRPGLVARLAADTIAVLPSVRVVLVEDDDDRRFHQQAYDLALTFPETALPSNPRLAFMPVMAKANEEGGKQSRKGAGGGGWTAVVNRMKELREQGLETVFRGLIDGDNKTDRLASGICRLARYSIESYWADPICLYHLLVWRDEQVGKELVMRGGVERRDLAELRTFDGSRLAKVVESVVAKLAKLEATASSPGGTREVVLHRKDGKITLQYPAWLWQATKAELEEAVRVAFTQVVLTPWKSTLELVGMVPEDLVAVYRQLLERT